MTAAFYAKRDNLYVLKLVGNLRYTMCPALSAFLNQLFEQQDYDDIWVDLTEATSIDSTCLGVLAKIANFMRQRFGKKPTLLSTNEDVNQVLESMSLQDVFNIYDGSSAAEDLPAQALPLAEPDKEGLARIVLDAHRTLSALNEANQSMFANVVEALQEQVPENS